VTRCANPTRPSRPRPASEAVRRELTLQRLLDVLIATLCLAACAWLLLAACVLIKLESPGPAIFRQRRLGRGRHPFTVHKLRTMRPDANPEIHRQYVKELIDGAQTKHSDGRRELFKLAADDRVTRIGRVLRRTSIDELPQLIDVLRGHMSLVGPRPVATYEAELYPPLYDRRFAVKPGITGLWQVSGRNECSYQEMMELDIAWVERRSLRLYLAILARTPWVLLCSRGAA
jgi:lipopolysaccharide/colanic/teichoic acid biosynthesis glycosyltransferase